MRRVRFALFFIFLVITLTYAQSVTLKTSFHRMIGNAAIDLACSGEAAARKYIWMEINETSFCRGLDWEWYIAPVFGAGSSYFEKQYLVEIYSTPSNPAGIIRLPILLAEGAFIEMLVTFTKVPSGSIQLVDTLEPSYSGTPSPGEHNVLINMILEPSANRLVFQYYDGGRTKHNTYTPYPLSIGQHTITFTALSQSFRVNIDGVDISTMPVIVKQAKVLYIDEMGIELQQMSYIGV